MSVNQMLLVVVAVHHHTQLMDAMLNNQLLLQRMVYEWHVQQQCSAVEFLLLSSSQKRTKWAYWRNKESNWAEHIRHYVQGCPAKS